MTKGTLRYVLGVLVIFGITGIASAGTINGSMALAGFGVTANGTDLSNSTLISATMFTLVTSSAGDYSIVPIGTNFGATVLDLTNLTTFTFGNATYGSFSTSSGFIVQQSTNFLDVFLLGTYTPAAGFSGNACTVCDPSATSLRFSVNLSGTSVSEGISLASPPAFLTPEPATFALMGGALIGLGVLLRRRRSS